MRTIDLNCDMGESFGAWKMGQDIAVMPHVSSVNIACGFHAGDPDTMRQTVEAAARHGIPIGAHPSLPDLAGFGRRDMAVSPNEAYALVLYQIGALDAFVRTHRRALFHVKPHGALYNMAARDDTLADAIAAAVRDFDPRLVLVGLADSALTRAGTRAGLRVAHEAFCDRRYQTDGSLVPRRESDAVLSSIDEAVAQALRIAAQGEVVARDGQVITLSAQTLCIHGDKADAAEFARRLRGALEGAGIGVAALSENTWT
ncbi:LamB/YcsF family protein [Tahibacter amnicola]|uniref:5-oxoprolinase subunit A n=1 Tax=Tahibacter amnicola TaxID=2976241 RepID=A0ABY6BI88_9GAMM|nr:5-oxoprolinase subunit PxpA [Tahibacter amnicola]UXI69555.1 LamB/YcsF family protein [Tahibacter amnicola]